MKNYPRVVRSLVACLVVLCVLAVATPLTMASLSGKPAGNPYSSIARSWFVYELVPGSVINDAVEVVNTGNETQTSFLYPADAISSNTGNFALKQKDEPMTDVGSWISISKQEVTLAPGASEVVPFTITVPASGADVGEHSGGIIVASMGQKATPQANGAPGISLTLRAATRVYITIPGELVRNVELLETKVGASQMRNYTLPFNLYPELSLLSVPKSYKFQSELQNSGNVGTQLKLTLKGKNSITGAYLPEQTSNPKLERDRTSTQVFEWITPVIGLFEFYIEGEYDKSTTQNGTANMQKFISEKMVVWVIPWDLILAGGFVFIALILLYLARRSYFSTKGWLEYKITAKDTLKSIAAAHGVSWKRLAIANKLSAPYSLNEISEILVPALKNSTEIAKKNVAVKNGKKKPSISTKQPTKNARATKKNKI